MRRRRKRLKQAKTVAESCDRLPKGAHGKEGVDGSSPSEGFGKAPEIAAFCLQGICSYFRLLRYGALSGAPSFSRRAEAEENAREKHVTRVR
jgi:hypothetical protein